MGGNNDGRAALSDGGVDTGINNAPDGITNAQYIESASGEIRWVNSGSVSGNIQAFAADAAGNSIDLSQQDWGSTYETLLAAVTQLQNSGNTVQLQIQGSFNGQAGSLLVGVFDPDVVGASDNLRGGEGNDFIDGGISAIDWRANEALEGSSSDIR